MGPYPLALFIFGFVVGTALLFAFDFFVIYFFSKRGLPYATAVYYNGVRQGRYRDYTWPSNGKIQFNFALRCSGQVNPDYITLVYSNHVWGFPVDRDYAAHEVMDYLEVYNKYKQYRKTQLAQGKPV